MYEIFNLIPPPRVLRKLVLTDRETDRRTKRVSIRVAFLLMRYGTLKNIFERENGLFFIDYAKSAKHVGYFNE